MKKFKTYFIDLCNTNLLTNVKDVENFTRAKRLQKRQTRFFLRLMALCYLIVFLMALTSCGSSRCTTKAGNYNTVNR